MIKNWIKRANRNGNAGIRTARHESALALVTGAPGDEEVVRLACELLESNKSRLHMIYVMEVERDSPLDAAIVGESRRGEQALARMEGIANGYNCIRDTQLAQARKTGVGAAVVREALDRDVEAIVMGTSVSDLYGGYSLDPHVPHILRHAPCRVILLRNPILGVPGLPAADASG